ncbi:uncharacterized protein LOC115143662 isoform X1 [Oncorhynchus nerka]|uniref:uncharacterized protein LOC115143662 isoform X1 n=1 Tax=Oncorhynchus nerka TaxID=8023 RepID=UPI0031B86D8F
MVSITETQKIGVGLTGFGLFFLLFGVLLYFDSVLLAFGNFCFWLAWRSSLAREGRQGSSSRDRSSEAPLSSSVAWPWCCSAGQSSAWLWKATASCSCSGKQLLYGLRE